MLHLLCLANVFIGSGVLAWCFEYRQQTAGSLPVDWSMNLTYAGGRRKHEQTHTHEPATQQTDSIDIPLHSFFGARDAMERSFDGTCVCWVGLGCCVFSSRFRSLSPCACLPACLNGWLAGWLDGWMDGWIGGICGGLLTYQPLDECVSASGAPVNVDMMRPACLLT